jgi:hypothetical protein
MSVRRTYLAYEKAFGEMPPLMFWGGTDDELKSLLEKAIERGEPVTVDELLGAQGLEPPPDDAVA